MWDTVEDSTVSSTEHLSHDRPCPHCGHALHVYLACDGCDCVPQAVRAA